MVIMFELVALEMTILMVVSLLQCFMLMRSECSKLSIAIENLLFSSGEEAESNYFSGYQCIVGNIAYYMISANTYP